MPEFRLGASDAARPERGGDAAARCALALSRAALAAIANLSADARSAVDGALAFEILVLESEHGKIAAAASKAARETREWLCDLSEPVGDDVSVLENAILAMAERLDQPEASRAA
ncbi:MAG: hypothetical protein U1E50_00535 [Caulobacteraceae bacterium]